MLMKEIIYRMETLDRGQLRHEFKRFRKAMEE